jgi:signal transduction histidine kinase
MNEPTLDARTIGVVVSLMYMLLPLGVGWILRHQDRPQSLLTWVGGNIANGLFISLAALKHSTPLSPAVLLVSVALGFAGILLRGIALQNHMERPLSWPAGCAGIIVLSAGFEIARRTSLEARMIYVVTVMLLGAGWLTIGAHQLARSHRSTSARIMSLSYGVVSLLLAARLWNLTLGGGEQLTLDQGGNALALTLVMLFTAVFGNIAYIGITLEGVRRRELAHAREAAQAAEAQRHSEARSERLLSLLHEREQMLREREEMLHLLAHEVRQPLNNASAALQSARHATTRAIDAADAAPLLGRLDRTSSVIRRITSILDNTLAASSLISSDSRLAPVEADLPSLVELCLADLAPPQRARVHVEHDPGLRTAAFDPGLLRLALRNLLVNALNHAPPDTPVVLRVSEQDEPLAVRFEVIDQGPGFDPALREHAFERGVRGRRSHGLGLGLYIARRVAELHHGHLEIVPPTPPGHGAWLRLTLPQDPID